MFVGVQQNGSGEDDVILLGDLNVDEYHLGNLGRLPDIGHVVSGVPTNTRRDKTYDNIVFDRRTTVEYTGRWGVLDLMQEFSLTEARPWRSPTTCRCGPSSASTKAPSAPWPRSRVVPRGKPLATC